MDQKLSNQIMCLIKDLARMSDESVFPQKFTTQNFTISLAGRTVDKSSSKSPASPVNQPPRQQPQVATQSLEQSSTKGFGRNGIPKIATRQYQENSASSRDKNSVGPANETTRSYGHSSKLVSSNSNRTKEIASAVDAQSSNLQLTIEERETLIRTILANELELRSKIVAQEKEIFSSPRVKRNSPANKDVNSSLLAMQAKVESMRAAQERALFASPEKPTQVENIQHNRLPSNQSTTPNSRYPKQMRANKIKRTLTPIPEISEVQRPTKNHHVENENETNRPRKLADDLNLSKNEVPVLDRNFIKRQNLAAIRAQEDIRQHQMESELRNDLISDINESFLAASIDDSDSLNELVIKDFAIRVERSEPDASVSSLPITEQAMLECKKLSDTIESLKNRFQIKVARDKNTAYHKRKDQAPTGEKVFIQRPTTPRTQNTRKQEDENPHRHLVTNENRQAANASTAPMNILDSENWGNIALPQPISVHRGKSKSPSIPEHPQNGSTSEEDFLNESDMQFDDVFGRDNVAQPTFPNTPTRKIFQKNNNNVDRTPQPNKEWIDENIDAFERPQFSELPSDDSDQPMTTSKRSDEINVDYFENIENMEDPQFPSETSSDEMACDSDFKPINHQIGKQVVEEPPHASSDTQHEKDIRRLEELLHSGELTSSFISQRFEEGVLDLLLRQSDSLWDPVVRGIPITYFIPSRNHGKSILDTSVNQENLNEPLIQRPHKRLPKYLESFEDESMADIANDLEPNNNEKINNSPIRDENQLIRDLPEFSYQTVQPYLYRRKVHNIMDSEDEPEDSVDILEDHEMNCDDLVNNVVEPTYDFKEANKIISNSKARKPGTREVFNKNQQRFNAIFGIDRNEPTYNTYVRSNDIELFYNEIPHFHSEIVRNVKNCPYHFDLLKSIYKKITKYVQQSTQPESSRTHNDFEEIMKRFNKIQDGRICARIQFCPDAKSPRKFMEDSLQSSKQHSPVKNVESAQQINTKSSPKENQQTQVPVSQKPVNIRKSVSFAKSPPRYSTSKSVQTKITFESNKKSRNLPTTGSSKATPVKVKMSNKTSSHTPKPLPRSETSTSANEDDNKWTSLTISEVNDLIQHARLAQANRKGSASERAPANKQRKF